MSVCVKLLFSILSLTHLQPHEYDARSASVFLKGAGRFQVRTGLCIQLTITDSIYYWKENVSLTHTLKIVAFCSTPFDKDIIPLYDYLMAPLKWTEPQ